MNYIASMLYTHLNGDEEVTFDLFMALIARKGLTALFVEEVPDFHVHNYLFEKLLKKYVPAVFNHLKDIEVDTSVITGNWFMTLFTNYFTFNMAMPILDNFFLEGW